MELVKIYHNVWRKELFYAILCFSVVVLTAIGDEKNSMGLSLLLTLVGLFFLFLVFRERLMNKPYLTISNDCIIINRNNNQEIINFDEVKSFEREKIKLWRYTMYTGSIVVYFVNDPCFVNLISADDLTIKSQKLCELLNKYLQERREKDVKR